MLSQRDEEIKGDSLLSLRCLTFQPQSVNGSIVSPNDTTKTLHYMQ